MTPRPYEITFAGEAVPAIASAFEDFDVIVGGGNTTVRCWNQFVPAAPASRSIGHPPNSGTKTRKKVDMSRPKPLTR